MKTIIFANTIFIILALAHAAYTSNAQDVQGSGLGENAGDVQLRVRGKVETEIESYGEPEIGLDSSNQSNTSLLSGTYNQSNHKKGVYKQGYFTQGHQGYTSYGHGRYGNDGYVYTNQSHTGTVSRTFNQGYARNITATYNQGYASNKSEIYNRGIYHRSHLNHASIGYPTHTQGGYGYSEHHHSGNILVMYNNQGNFTNPFIKEVDALRNGGHIFHGRSRNVQGGYNFPKQDYSGNISGTINHSTFRGVVMNQGNLVPGHGSHFYDGHGRNAHRGYGNSNQGHSGNILVRLNNQDNFKNFFSNQGGLIIGHGVLAGHGNIE